MAQIQYPATHAGRSALIAFAALLLILGAIGVMLREQLTREVRNHDWVTHTQEVRLELSTTESLLKDAETGQRGFLYTGDPRYLQPYESAVKQIDARIDHVAQLIVDNPIQRLRIPALRDLERLRLAELGQTIALYRSGKPGAAKSLVRSGAGKLDMDRFRQVIIDMQQEEIALEVNRSAAYARSRDITALWILILFVVAGSGFILITWLFLAQMQFQKVLEDSEKRFRALVTATSDVVYRMSSNWRQMEHLVSRDFIPDTVEPSETWIGKYIPVDDRERVWAAVRKAIHNKGVFELEHRVLRVDGSLGWTFSRAVPTLDSDGEVWRCG